MHEIKRGKESFYIGRDEQSAPAYIHWNDVDEEVIDVDHTVVSEELSGQGLAGILLSHVVNMARKENKQIIATCPYAKRKLEGNDDYADLLYQPD